MEWKNDIFNIELQKLYSNFSDDFKQVFISQFDIYSHERLKQSYPNTFIFHGLEIELIYRNQLDQKTSYSVEFPKVQIFNGEIFISVGSPNKEIIQKIYVTILDEKFDHQSFKERLGISLNKLVESYTNYAVAHFDIIRNNYFENRKVIDYENEYFSIPNVVLTYRVSEKIEGYGYKPGEGRNYNHQISHHYIDINNYNDELVKAYIISLNQSNPKSSFTEYMEMSPTYSDIDPEEDFYELDLSRKINWYIHLNKEYGNRYDYSELKESGKDFFSQNDILFEDLVMIYVIVTKPINSIIDFFSPKKHSQNRSYQNLVLISEYFLKKKYSHLEFINEFHKIRDSIFKHIRTENFHFNLTPKRIELALEKIETPKDDIEKLRYFYINYLNFNKGIIDHDQIAYIFYNHFCRE